VHGLGIFQYKYSHWRALAKSLLFATVGPFELANGGIPGIERYGNLKTEQVKGFTVQDANNQDCRRLRQI